MTELEIKLILVRHFLEHSKDFVIGAEVPFLFGERRADLAVFEDGNLTAYEIKSARDNVSRLSYQIDSYKKFYDFCYVVCELGNLSEVRAALPREIGILMIEDGKVVRVRVSKKFKRHDKIALSSALSVQKLKSLAKSPNLRSKSELCEFVSKNNTMEYLRELSRSDFVERYGVVSRLLRQETTLHLNSDDIYTITKKAPTNLKRRTFS
ncbi:sce7726 family protein [Vibrio vulnificus]|uniref:sce7726 family protein n=1 Tax=Vibrio vulnificus TaxID=672 RepID=UPI001A2BF79D|nr:sce7726 family protein [Vibrio vulnificus]EID0693326.1 sce7726 family protein [Vibrio vulnificus]EIU7058870.1 sce7726 family protein [Vibrio vulnificus]HAS8376335.1 protein cII [Vibrio vulnificus]